MITKSATHTKKTQGGKREGAGRKAGIPNKVTAELGAAARAYTAEALEILAKIARSGKSEAARVAAACALLDRGHGKPKVQVEGTVGMTLEQLVLSSFQHDAQS